MSPSQNNSSLFKEKIKSIGFVGHKHFYRDTEKKLDRDLAEYKKVRAEGIQPNTTKREDVEKAKIFSDHYGSAYRGDSMTETLAGAGIIDHVAKDAYKGKWREYAEGSGARRS